MPNDVQAGLIFTVVGVAALVYAAMTLNAGTAAQMGPGYFPMALGGLLAVLGVIIALTGFRRHYPDQAAVSWRGIGFVVLAIVTFALSVGVLGLLATVAVTALLAAYASNRMTLRIAVPVVVGLTAFSVVVFSFALSLPLPVLPRFPAF